MTKEITREDALDVAYVRLRRGRVAKTVEVRPGILVDLDKTGEVIGIEILSVSKIAPALEASTAKRRGRYA